MASRLVEDSRDGYLTVTPPKKTKKVEKRALLDDDQGEEKPKRRRFCECDPDAISVEEEE